MDNKVSARTVLERGYLLARGKVLEVAALLDRLERCADAAEVRDDPRVLGLRQAVAALSESGPGRAERVQMLLSLPYDSDWTRPKRG